MTSKSRKPTVPAQHLESVAVDPPVWLPLILTSWVLFLEPSLLHSWWLFRSPSDVSTPRSPILSRMFGRLKTRLAVKAISKMQHDKPYEYKKKVHKEQVRLTRKFRKPSNC